MALTDVIMGMVGRSPALSPKQRQALDVVRRGAEQAGTLQFLANPQPIAEGIQNVDRIRSNTARIRRETDQARRQTDRRRRATRAAGTGGQGRGGGLLSFFRRFRQERLGSN